MEERLGLKIKTPFLFRKDVGFFVFDMNQGSKLFEIRDSIKSLKQERLKQINQ